MHDVDCSATKLIEIFYVTVFETDIIRELNANDFLFYCILFIMICFIRFYALTNYLYLIQIIILIIIINIFVIIINIFLY